MRRREFITLVGGAAAAWPVIARAQQPAQPTRRVGLLHSLPADDPAVKAATETFVRSLGQSGWNEGRNLHIDFRWGEGDATKLQVMAAELVRLGQDVILTGGSPGLAAARQATQNIPIVFVNVADPVGQGIVPSLAHPGGNITGFTNFEIGMGGKWLNVIRDLAPRTTRVALIVNPDNPNASYYTRSIETVAATLGIVVLPTFVRTRTEIENAIPALTGASVDGAIVLPDGLTITYRQLVTDLIARIHLPAVYAFRDFVVGGGLASYGIEFSENYRGAAEYVDRILRGATPADLPIQAPSKFEFVLNLKAAKALGLTIPQPMLLAADEVIE
jgi:putative ABC transport system substrate-binding protein